MKRRVLLVTDFYPPFLGGTERQVYLLAQELTHDGYEVLVATVWHKGLPEYEVTDGVKVFRLRPWTTRVPWFFSNPERRFHPPVPEPGVVLELRRIVREQKPWIIHAFGWIAYSCLLVTSRQIPLVISIQDYGYSCAIRTLMHNGAVCDGPAVSKCIRCAANTFGLPKSVFAVSAVFLGRKLIRRRTAAFHSLSRYVEEITRRDLSGNAKHEMRVFTVPPIVLPNANDQITDNADHWQPYVRQLPDQAYILFVGALIATKGIHEILRAYQGLGNAPPLVLIGTTWPETPHSFPANTIVIENAPPGFVMYAWQQSLFGLAPSVWAEPFGGVVLEAMSCGKAVIGSAIGGHRDMITPGENGFLVQPGDTNALRDKMQQLIDDPELCKRMGEAAYKQSLRFQAAALLPEIINIYEHALEHQLRKRPGFRLRTSLEKNRVMLTNAVTIVGTTGVNSVLGFAYWFVAARLFEQTDVGLASAMVSAMLLLGTFATLGLGYMLLGELSKTEQDKIAMILTALAISASTGFTIGIVFALIAPLLSTELMPLRSSWPAVLVFALGTGLTAGGIVLDQSVIGLLRGNTQLWRNVVFASSKLAILYIGGTALYRFGGVEIFASWVGGIVISFAVFFALFGRQNLSRSRSPLRWQVLHDLRKHALYHHALNLTLEGPSRILPIIVTVLLSAQVNASFYIAWMLAAFLFVSTDALTMVLYATGDDKQPQELASKTRTTLTTAILLGLIGSIALFLSAEWILAWFGETYAESAALSLRILALAIFPLILKTHYIAIQRIHRRIRQATVFAAAGAIIEITLATAGVLVAGLPGLASAWLVALILQAFFVVPLVRTTMTPARHG